MNLLYRCLLFFFAIAAPLAAQADTSVLLVNCSTQDNGAEIWVNGKLMGKCPLDMEVDAGALKLRVVKKEGALHERIFEQEIQIDRNASKSVRVWMSAPQLTEEGQRQEAARLRAEAEAEQLRKRTENETVQRILLALKEQGLEPGKSFRDCPDCPEMVVVPPGRFIMGDPGWQEIFIDHAFAAGKFEVTFAEWDACFAAGGCGSYELKDEGWGRGERPVIYVRWYDAKQYVEWLSQKTGKTYRLLSEAEWEYAARAGTTTAYSWGDAIGNGNANCVGCGSQWDNKQTAPAGSFQPNAFGLYDMHGNVWEWLEDCYKEDCTTRILRGGSWRLEPQFARAGKRTNLGQAFRYRDIGFRLARVLP